MCELNCECVWFWVKLGHTTDWIIVVSPWLTLLAKLSTSDIVLLIF
jgi:hypothetical protein